METILCVAASEGHVAHFASVIRTRNADVGPHEARHGRPDVLTGVHAFATENRLRRTYGKAVAREDIAHEVQ